MKSQLIYDHNIIPISKLKECDYKIFSLHSEPHVLCLCTKCKLTKKKIVSLTRKKDSTFQKYENKIINKAEDLLVLFIKELNEYHKINLSKRSWKLILWPWLYTLVTIIYDLELRIKNNKKLDKEHLFINVKSKPSIIANNYENFTNSIKQSDTYDLILSFISNKYLKNIEINELKSNFQKKHKPSYIKTKIYKFTNVLRLFTKNSAFVFYKSYLPFYIKLFFMIKYKSFPVIPALLNNSCEFFNNLDLKFRRSYNTKNELYFQICKFLIPKSYLEDFKAIDDYSKKILPKKPKLIYTANAHVGEDLFNIWAAQKINSSKFLIAQHGGHYGLGKTSALQSYEYEIGDYFFSWGWVDKKYKKVLPIGTWLKKIKYSPKKINPYLYIIGSGSSKYLCSTISMPIGADWKLYIKGIKTFVDNLNQINSSNIFLRPYHSNIVWDQINIFKTNFPKINIESIENDITQSIKKSRLVICTWNSTNFLHLLFSNIPFICLWDKNLFSLSKKNKLYLDKLNDVNIVHYNPKSAAYFIDSIWPHIDSWWNEKSTQNARKNFLSNYCVSSRKNLNEFKKIFSDIK